MRRFWKTILVRGEPRSGKNATCLRRSRAIFESKGACVRKVTLIDATVIGSASKGDKDAAWVRHRRGRPRMATRPTLRPPRTAASSAASRRPWPTRPMSISRLQLSPMSRARFMPTGPMMRWRSKRRSRPGAEPRSSCARAIAGWPPRGAKRTIVCRGPFAPGLKRSSEPGTAATASDACDGSAFPRQGCKSISRSSPTTSNGMAHANSLSGPATRICKTARRQSPSRRRHLTAQPAICRAQRS